MRGVRQKQVCGVRCVGDRLNRGSLPGHRVVTTRRPRSARRATLLAMWSRRQHVDYALQRRATLRALGTMMSLLDVCDADPYLLRAAKYHGEPTEHRCPVCRKETLTHVTYVYGDELGRYSGRIKATRELEPMAREFGEFTVYVVEVCRGCAWNHLNCSFVLGDGVPRRQSRRRAEEQ